MKKFFIVTDITGEIISKDLIFVNELDAATWFHENKIEGRAFIEMVLEIVK